MGPACRCYFKHSAYSHPSLLWGSEPTQETGTRPGSDARLWPLHPWPAGPQSAPDTPDSAIPGLTLGPDIRPLSKAGLLLVSY